MKIRLRLFFSFVLLGLLALVHPGAAKADSVVTYMGTTYDITTVETNNVQGIAGITSTPWYGNLTLSGELASLVGDGDTVNSTLLGFPTGPLFVSNISAGTATVAFEDVGGLQEEPLSIATLDGLEVDYAVAAPEPGTLSMMFAGLLGLGLLVGVKRYGRNRLATEA